MILYLLLAILYVVVEYVQLNKIVAPKNRIKNLKYYPQQFEPIKDLSPAASQIILSQNAILTPNIIYGVMMDWALKGIVTIEPIDASFGFKDGKIDDFLILKKNNSDKMNSLRNWEKNLYQELFANKNSFQVSELITTNNVTDQEEVLAKHWEIQNRSLEVPKQIIKEELYKLTLTKNQLTRKNIIWLILPFLQIPLFFGLLMFFTAIFPDQAGMIIPLSLLVVFMSAPFFCFISIMVISRIIVNKNTTGIYCNKDGVEAKRYLLGLISYIYTAEKERIIFHAKDKSLSELTLLPYAVTFGIIKPLIDFDTEPRIIDKSEYENIGVINSNVIIILALSLPILILILILFFIQMSRI